MDLPPPLEPDAFELDADILVTRLRARAAYLRREIARHDDRITELTRIERLLAADVE
jgi:hypothetical protein